MSDLSIRDFPASTHRELRRRAALAELERLRFSLPRGAPTTDEMLREDRAR
ncbi:MAG TPA: hypothetical protein VNE39_27710 [Planctomycetota bacterium]|nr:hypothetical protein [Planctomycetota bacterium]